VNFFKSYHGIQQTDL